MKYHAVKPAARHRFAVLKDREFLVGALLLSAVLIIGLITAPDYGITTDEFIFDPYGPLALAWYASGFSDRSLFKFFDVYLYGPWFQMLVAAAQSLHLANPFTVRHALSFVVGLLGIAALIPIGRLAVGRWAGSIAVVLCLTTGNLYGHLFFTPNDVPFMAAMTWATLAVIVMVKHAIPRWPSVVAAGLLSGLAIATRFGGVLAQVYLLGGMGLCALELFAAARPGRAKALLAIAVRTLAALVLGWITAIALWPWLQAADPPARFLEAYRYFIRSYVQFEFQAWGQKISSAALPWHYIPGQLAARLPEGFVALLAVAALFGVVALVRFFRASADGMPRGEDGALAQLTRSRGLLIVTVAALGPPLFVIARGSVMFDAVRHMLFILPMLALLAAWALQKLAPLLLRMPIYAAGAAVLYFAATIPALVYLHPLEYIAMNAFAGGVAGAYGRFDLDYWSAAATEAARRLQGRLERDRSARFATRPPRVVVCIGWRESMTGPLFPVPWIVVTDDTRQADFAIETERSRCGHPAEGAVIERVRRFGRTFARTIAISRDGDGGGPPPRK
jgi:hypothetical protein